MSYEIIYLSLINIILYLYIFKVWYKSFLQSQSIKKINLEHLVKHLIKNKLCYSTEMDSAIRICYTCCLYFDKYKT